MSAYETLKTAAEQAAYDFGQTIAELRLGPMKTELIGNKYAFTHQMSAFPRSNNGYARLMRAYDLGAIDYATKLEQIMTAHRSTRP